MALRCTAAFLSRLVVAAVAVLCLSPTSTASPPTAAALDDGTPMSADQRERCRKQWSEFGPYISMSSELYLVKLSLESVKEAAARIAGCRSLQFDAHPDLKAVGPPMAQYLVESEARVIPTIRAELTPSDLVSDPEGSLATVLLELASRAVEGQVVRAWQSELDHRARATYEALLPMARSLAGPARESATEIEVLDIGSGGLAVRNNSGQRLTNVTLSMDLATIGDRRARHYFFLSEWAGGSTFTPRAASDWSDVGLAGTTRGTVEVFSDQARWLERPFELRSHLVNAIERVGGKLAEESPNEALRFLGIASKEAKGDEAASRLISQLRDYARDRKGKLRKAAEDHLSALNKRLKALDRPDFRGRKVSKEVRHAAEERYEATKDSLKRQIEAARKKLNDLR